MFSDLRSDAVRHELQKEEEGSGKIVNCHAASYLVIMTDIKSSVAFGIAMRLMVS